MNILLFVLAIPSIATILIIIASFLTNGPAEKRHWWRMQVLIAFDQLFNSFFRGWADESISSRSYRKSLEGHPLQQEFIDFIASPWEDEHCKKSFQGEFDRRQSPPEARGNQ